MTVKFPSFRRAGAAVAVATLALVACGSDATTDESSSTEALGTVQVTDAWTRQPADGQSITAVYATVTNGLSTDITLTGATTNVTETVELHDTTTDDGMMSMAEVPGGFVVPAGDTFAFESGGPHIMLIDVDPATYPTDFLEVTLLIDGAEPISVQAEVRALIDDHSTGTSMAHMETTP